MNSASIRIGFVGAGKQAQCAHMRNYTGLENCTLTGVADPDLELAEKVAARYGIEKAYSSHTEMFQKAELDAVIVVLPPLPFAEKILLELIEAGVHVFTEKPLAYSVAAGQRLTAAAKKSDKLFAVGYHRRSDLAVMQAKAEIERLKQSGELGKLQYVRLHVSLAGDWIAGGYDGAIAGSAAPAPVPFPNEEFPGMTDASVLKFRMFSGAHSHHLDKVRCLLGNDYRITHVDPTGILLAVESTDGVPGVFEFTPYASSHDWREETLVAFEKGYIKVSIPAPVSNHIPGTLEIFRDKEGTTVPVFPAQGALQQQAVNFLTAIRGGGNPFCGIEDAVKSQEIALKWAQKLQK
jgi:predicted dehydrogenase